MSAPRRNGPLIIALSSSFFGLMAVVARLVSGQVSPSQLATLRFMVGALGCAAFYLARGQRPALHQWRWLLLRGFFGSLAVVTYFFAIERLGAARATVLNYSSPIYAAVFAAWLLGERTSLVQRLGLVVATVGAALVTLSTSSTDNLLVPDLGAIAGVFSAVAGGAAITTIRKLRNDTDAVTVFFAFCVVGLVTNAPLAASSWLPMSQSTLWLCVGVGVLSIAGQMLFTWGMGFTSATTGSATTQLVPVVAWVLALTWLDEPVTLLGVLGAVACVGGVLLGVMPARAVSAAPEPEPSKAP